MKIIDHEIKRYITRVKEFKQKMEEIEEKRGEPDYEELVDHMRKEERKLGIMVKKQEKVLFVAFHLLLNLAEDL